MPSTIAIDVVLLPPPEIMTLAKQLNQQLWESSHDGFQFDETHLPHITLVQQYVPTQQLQNVFSIIEKIAKTTTPLSLSITKIYGNIVKELNIVSLELTSTPEIQKLQRNLLDALEPFVTSGNEDGWYKKTNEHIRLGSLRWLENFRNPSHRFQPHITLGVSPTPFFNKQLTFNADRLALCHLGNFNTCRKILQEWQLQ